MLLALVLVGELPTKEGGETNPGVGSGIESTG